MKYSILAFYLLCVLADEFPHDGHGASSVATAEHGIVVEMMVSGTMLVSWSLRKRGGLTVRIASLCLATQLLVLPLVPAHGTPSRSDW